MKLLQGTFMWKLVNAVHPNSISEKFPLTYSQAINNHQNKLVIPYCHRAVSKRSLAYTAYKLWNHYLCQKFGMDRHTGSSLWWINVEVDWGHDPVCFSVVPVFFFGIIYWWERLGYWMDRWCPCFWPTILGFSDVGASGCFVLNYLLTCKAILWFYNKI